MRSVYSAFAVRVVASLILVSGTAATARAQAWLPAKGEGTVSVLFTNVLSKDHYLPDERFDFGHIDSNTMLFDVTYGVSDRLAVTAGLPVVMSRYRGRLRIGRSRWTMATGIRPRRTSVSGSVRSRARASYGDAVHWNGSPER